MARVENVYRRVQIVETTALHEAVKENDVDWVEHLLSQGADVNIRDHCGRTPLILASESITEFSHHTVIYVLLKNGANPNAQDNNGNSALHYLAVKAHVKVVTMLLNRKPEINKSNRQGETALLIAMVRKNYEVAKLLVKQGSNVNKPDENGLTPLHVVCDFLGADFKMMLHLIENGADINAVDAGGRIPLMRFLKTLRFYSFRLKASERKQAVKLLVEYTDFRVNSVNVQDSYYEYLFEPAHREHALQHLAKWKVLNLPYYSSLSNLIETSDHVEYYNNCTKELELAKNTMLSNSWVTFLNLVTDNDKKLKYYAGNKDLVKDYKKICIQSTFPIYRTLVQERMKKAIKERKLFDKSAETLINYLPVFNPIRLILRDILDQLTPDDYQMIISKQYSQNILLGKRKFSL